MKKFVLYHRDCADGFGAAYAAWTELDSEAEYIPVQYGEPMPEIPDGSQVYVVDFSYSREEILALAARSMCVVVLDHHKTAQDALRGLDGAVEGLRVVFDMGRSGAVLAWDHFHPGEPTPLLLQYIQDRDLWLWRMTGSKEFSAALSLETKDFLRWDDLASDLCDVGKWQFREFIDRGETVLEHQRRIVSNLCDRADWADVADHRVPAVNSPVFQSEIGDELCRRHPEAPFAAIYFCPDVETEVWSLRSRGGFDVSDVAKLFGGGGHRAAAGFRRSRPR